MGMKDRLQEAVQKVQQERHFARRSVAMVLVLAMLTSMSVSWRLHQDGVALAADAVHYYCGKEEHVHTDDCYIQSTEPTCGYYEGEIIDGTIAGVDNDAQYGVDADDDASTADWNEAESEPEDQPAAQAASEPEVVLHHHTADCYEEQEVLTCGYDDSDHVHDEACYDQETGELLCTEHVHDDDCYTLENVLVCGYEEGEPEETDDGVALYDMDESNAADSSSAAEEPASAAVPEPEKETAKPAEDAETDAGYTVHHHTDECYGKVLICGKEEHEHTAECLINPNAEIDAEYDAKTPARTDTDWADDMVLVAKSQLGYTESKADVDDNGNGYTMYADQYYKDKPLVYADWDSTFVAYCLYHAGVPQDIIPQYASISALRGELARMNCEYYTDDPQEFASILPGDIVMYKNADAHETIGVVSDITVDDESGLTTALTVISGDVATGYESDGETTIDQVAEVSVAPEDVTSFVSVNAAYGYGVSDLVDDDVAVAQAEAIKLPWSYVTEQLGDGQIKYDPDLDAFKTDLRMDFTIPHDNIKADQIYYWEFPDSVTIPDNECNLGSRDMYESKGSSTRVGSFRFAKVDGKYRVEFKVDKTYYERHNKDFTGTLEFSGILKETGRDNDGHVIVGGNDGFVIKFGDKEIVNENPSKTDRYDLKTEKKGEYDKEAGKLSYTVTITSKKGTPGDVTYEDKIKETNGKNFPLKAPEITIQKRTFTERRSSNTAVDWAQSGEPTVWSTIGTPTDYTYTSDKTVSGQKYNGVIDMTLPQMKTTYNEDKTARTYEQYQVTYTYDVPDLENANYHLFNKIDASSTDTKTQVSDYAQAELDVKNEYTINKSAGNYDTNKGTIQWTITLNENRADITDAKLTDNIKVGSDTLSNVFATAQNIQINPNKGYQFVDASGNVVTDSKSAAGIQFIQIDGKKNDQKYTITYETAHAQGDQKYQVNNSATLTPNDGKDGVTKDTSKDVPPQVTYIKEALTNDAKVENGKLIIPWRIGVDFSKVEKIAKGTEFWDTAVVNNGTRKPHAMTAQQAKEMTFTWADSSNNPIADGTLDPSTYKVTFYKDTIQNDGSANTPDFVNEVSADDPNAEIGSFKVVFTQDVTRPEGAAKLLVRYNTTADATQMRNGNEYRNVFKMKDREWSQWSYKQTPPSIAKTDGNNKTEETPSTDENGILTWKIKVNTGNLALYESMTVTDTLPEGVTLQSVQVFKDNAALSDVVNVTPGVEFTNQKAGLNEVLKGKYDTSASPNKLTITLSNKNKLVQSKEYVFVIKCKVNLDEDGKPIVADATFKNEATATLGGVTYGPASQTQTWEKTTPSEPEAKVLNKLGNWSAPNRRLDYSVEINPDGKSLTEYKTLKLEDVLTLAKHPANVHNVTPIKGNPSIDTNQVDITAVLLTDTVKLYYATKGADGKLVKGAEVNGWALQTRLDSSDEWNNQYHMTISGVPNGQALILEYSYRVDNNLLERYPKDKYEYADNAQVQLDRVTNRIELSGTGESSQTCPESKFWNASTSGFNMGSGNSLRLIKIEKGNEQKTLAGVQFTLQQWNAESENYQDVTENGSILTCTTDESGEIVIEHEKGDIKIGDAATSSIQQNVLYRLIETQAKEGYETPLPEEAAAQAVYFYYGAGPISGNEEDIAKATNLDTGTKTVYVENTPNATDITVRKVWKDAEGKDTTAGGNTVSMQLYRATYRSKPNESGFGMVSSKVDNLTNVSKFTEQLATLLGNKAAGTSFDLKITTSIKGRSDLTADRTDRATIYWNNALVSPQYDQSVDKSDPYNPIVQTVYTYHLTMNEGVNILSGKVDTNGVDNSYSGVQTVEASIDTENVVEPTENKPTNTEKYNWDGQHEDGKFELSSSSNVDQNWMLTIENLPLTGIEEGQKVYYAYYAVETAMDEASVSNGQVGNWIVTQGDTPITSGTITIYNTQKPDEPDAPTYELPSTGSPGGTIPYTAGGAAIALTAVLCGYRSKRKKREEE